MFEGDLTYDEALIRILTSKFINRLIKEPELLNLGSFLAEHPSCPLELLPKEFYDVLLNEVCSDDRNISFELLSDDKDNPESVGPWPATVYGFAGVWIFQSPELDNLYFSDRNEAIEHCYHCAHEIIESESNYPIQTWQIETTTVDAEDIETGAVLNRPCTIEDSILKIIRETPIQTGLYTEECVLPIGRSVTYRFSLAVGRGWQAQKSKYLSLFGEPPSWLNYLHPSIRSWICRLALDSGTELPREPPDKLTWDSIES